MTSQNRDTTFLKDKDWSVIDGELIIVHEFTPLAGRIESGEVVSLDTFTPYASIQFQCRKLSNTLSGFIHHKIDFLHFFLAFETLENQQGLEVLAIWSRKNYKGFTGFFSAAMPKLIIAIYPEGTYKKISNPDYKPEIVGVDRLISANPLHLWKPDVIR
ncbi:MAG: hypothetical protein H8E46_06835 [FCB group bacterium]|nr:hypothetical protein [FCB group bacterium]